MARSLVLIFSLISSAQSYTTSQPNCTAPTTSVNFFSSSETRGTLDILWSCLFTIFACTWTVQHLNVPEQREDRDQGWRGDIKWALKGTLTSAKWMLLTAIAPEVLIAKNWSDIVDIDGDFKRLSDLAQQDEVPWSRTHTLFANMGGFVIRSHIPKRAERLNGAKSRVPASDQPMELQETSNLQRLQTIRGDLISSKNNIEASDVETQSRMPPSGYSNPYHLLASDLAALREASLIEKLPYITISELGDKSKSDSFLRFIALTQILWITVQIMVRAHRHLAIAQIEIAVAAFAICAIVIYGLNWEKPKGVQTPYTILQYHGNIPPAILSRIGDWRTTSNSMVFSLLEMHRELLSVLTDYKNDKRVKSGHPIRNHFTPSEDGFKVGSAQLAGLLIGGTIFGAVHLIARDFVFPTPIEHKFWLASSIYATSSPWVMLLVVVFFKFFENLKGIILNILVLVLFSIYVLMMVSHIVARLFLLVEIFRTLCFLPPSAYVATWATNVPHIT